MPDDAQGIAAVQGKIDRMQGLMGMDARLCPAAQAFGQWWPDVREQV